MKRWKKLSGKCERRAELDLLCYIIIEEVLHLIRKDGEKEKSEQEEGEK